jgi:hypothetical protein
MTLKELNPNGYTPKNKAIYKGKEYEIISLDFYEDLVAIDETGDGYPWWKRSENIEKII